MNWRDIVDNAFTLLSWIFACKNRKCGANVEALEMSQRFTIIRLLIGQLLLRTMTLPAFREECIVFQVLWKIESFSPFVWDYSIGIFWGYYLRWTFIRQCVQLLRVVGFCVWNLGFFDKSGNCVKVKLEENLQWNIFNCWDVSLRLGIVWF